MNVTEKNIHLVVSPFWVTLLLGILLVTSIFILIRFYANEVQLYKYANRICLSPLLIRASPSYEADGI